MELSFINSYFEFMSGLTGTGFTVFENIKNIGSTINFMEIIITMDRRLFFLIFLILIFSNKQINFKMIDLSFNIEKKINFSSNLLNVTNRIF